MQILVQLKISCVSVGKLYRLSEPQFPCVKDGHNNIIYFMRLFLGLNEIEYYKVVSMS